MLKSELIEALAKDIRLYGDEQLEISLLGNINSVELRDISLFHFCSVGTQLLCDIDNYEGGSKNFLKDIKKMDDWK